MNRRFSPKDFDDDEFTDIETKQEDGCYDDRYHLERKRIALSYCRNRHTNRRFLPKNFALKMSSSIPEEDDGTPRNVGVIEKSVGGIVERDDATTPPRREAVLAACRRYGSNRPTRRIRFVPRCTRHVREISHFPRFQSKISRKR